jgi:LPS export ABC transporter protein LptC
MIAARWCVALLLGAPALSACGGQVHTQLSPPPSHSAGPQGPVYHISAQGTGGRPVVITNIVAGAPEYTLLAASVIYSTDLNKGRFSDTTLHFYKGRNARLTVTAPTAVVDEVSHNVLLSGGVHAKTASGVTLTADRMVYDDTTRLLTATGHVVAVEPGGNMLTGREAIADLDLQQIRLYGELPHP